MFIFLLLLTFLNASASIDSPLKQTLDKNSDVFFLFPRIRQITQELKASATLSSTATDDRGLNLSGSITRTKSPDIGQIQLINSGGVIRRSSNDLESSLSLGLKDAGHFNSTQLKLSTNWTKIGYQKIDSSTPSLDSTKNYSLNLSYDVIRGGYKDINYLSNKSTERTQFTALMSSVDNLVRNYLDYRYLLLDIYASYCKVLTSKEDLEVMKKAVQEIKLSYELKSVSYKQYLNVMDTYNFIQRNFTNYELNYEIFLQKVLFWADTPLDEWEASFVSTIQCPKDKKQFSSFLIQKPEERPIYTETTLGIQTRSAAEASQYSYMIAQQQIRPSVRPFVELSQNNFAGYQDKIFAVGVSVNWDTPSVKDKGQVLGSKYTAGAAQITNDVNERQFISQMKSYLVRFDKNKELLKLSIESLETSSSLVHLLEVQKSIGQVDTPSLSNAYTQRNSILNSIYDSMVNLEKTQQEIYYLKNWKELLSKAGISIR